MAEKKPDAGVEGKGETKSDVKTETDVKSEAKPDAKAEAKSDAKPEAKSDAKSESKSEAETKKRSQELPAIEPPEPKAEPWPDATPQPMKPVAAPNADTAPMRARSETMAMGTDALVGKPPEMPRMTAPPPLAVGNVENPTHMPGPKDVPAGNPDDPAPAPGVVPPGDSRSMRRGNEFALVYRIGTSVISRSGTVGKRGQWRVVEYPTSAAASHGYAKECSRFVSEGFSDYRD